MGDAPIDTHFQTLKNVSGANLAITANMDTDTAVDKLTNDGNLSFRILMLI